MSGLFRPNAAQYCIFAAVGGQIGPYKIGDPGFEPAVQAWAQFLASHARDKGITPENIYLLLVDEPYENDQDAVIFAWAKAIRAANTGLQIWEDPTYGDMTLANQEMVAACHVLCPNPDIRKQGSLTRRISVRGNRRAFALNSIPAAAPPACLILRLLPSATVVVLEWNA